MTASLSGASLRLLVRRRAELPREPQCGLQHAVHLVRVRVRVRVRVGVGVGVGVGVRVRVAEEELLRRLIKAGELLVV